MSAWWAIALALFQAETAESPPSTDSDEAADAVDALLGPPVVAPLPAKAPSVAPAPVAPPPAVRPGPRSVRPFEMPAVVPTEPVPYATEIRLPDAPVTLDGYRGQYEPPKDVIQLRFERGVADTLRRAATLAGAMEGAWRVTDPDGRPLYDLALIDPGAPGEEIEGAWRDLRRPGALNASGPLLSASSDGAGGLVLRFFEAGRTTPSVLSLRRVGPSRYTGELAGAGQARLSVVMTPEN